MDVDVGFRQGAIIILRLWLVGARYSLKLKKLSG